ncbi:MAG: DUF2541 family protein [Thermoanaerobaculia bacterium]|jgi:hypothetical protein|nr:DUF2541 family protein [Thermoanaerobaculia bacterium]
MNRSRLPLALVVLALLATAYPAAADRWVLLGEKHVTDRVERDTIVVTAARGDFEAIQVRVKRAAVRFVDVKVIYGNGSTDDLAIRDVIPAGGESRVIDLKGGDRVLHRVDFVYEAKSLGRRGALVQVWGRR